MDIVSSRINCMCLSLFFFGRFQQEGREQGVVLFSRWMANADGFFFSFFSCAFCLLFCFSNDQASVETGEQMAQVPTRAAMNSVTWHPSSLVLAFAGDDKDRATMRDSGNVYFVSFSEQK